MFNLNRKSLLALAGVIWLFMGLILTWKGLHYLTDISKEGIEKGAYPVLLSLQPRVGTFEGTCFLLIAIGLLIGSCKGIFVLSKSAKRVISRIYTLPNPSKITSIYSPQYCLLIAGMVFLGMSMKFLGVPEDIRGVIDIAVGSGLITSSFVYFKSIAFTYDT